MNLRKKKELAAKVLNVGKNRLIFKNENLSEIKEAITRQDIISLKDDGIILIKPIKGRKKIKKRKIRRGFGKIKKNVNKRKQVYVKITRKLREYIKNLRNSGVINRELYKKLRNKIRMREFKSKSNLKDYLQGLELNLDKVVDKEKKIKKTKKTKSMEK